MTDNNTPYENHNYRSKFNQIDSIVAKYHTLKLLYDNKDKKTTITEIKMNPQMEIFYLANTLYTLENEGLIKKSIDYKTITENSKNERIKSYRLTTAGFDMFREFEEFNGKYGFRDLEDMMGDFYTFIKSDKYIGSANLRNKLNTIEQERKEKNQ
jgi:hypothetical protein